MYQRVGGAAYKADLENTLLLAAYLGNPEKSFRSIHVAGTNGKGSVSHMLASILQEAGYKVGLYTSPHLKDFRERIRINGKMIPKPYVTQFISEHRPFFEAHTLSFFEMTVGLAFDFFRKEQVDIAVIEVGMGGRLDSTNIIVPELSVITNIGLDHTQYLGTTLSDIAYEKAGIIKRKVPVVVGETTPETKVVFQNMAGEKKSILFFAESEPLQSIHSDLEGAYQVKNKQTVWVAIQKLMEQGWELSDEDISKGFGNVKSNTGLRGRWDIIGEQPKVICDTAHNKEGLQWVLKQLKEEPHAKLHVVLGVVADKQLEYILPLFPVEAAYYFCKPDVPRGLDAADLARQAGRFGLNGEPMESVSAALAAARRNAVKEDLIFVGGSTFVVAEVL